MCSAWSPQSLTLSLAPSAVSRRAEELSHWYAIRGGSFLASDSSVFKVTWGLFYHVSNFSLAVIETAMSYQQRRENYFWLHVCPQTIGHTNEPQCNAIQMAISFYHIVFKMAVFWNVIVQWSLIDIDRVSRIRRNADHWAGTISIVFLELQIIFSSTLQTPYVPLTSTF